ncbi:MAG: carboxypeptidase regulatory-like domain-containing protein, partial [Acidobacteriaceae bacterium]|nr:carboxypeptidase regulatory-like domain-containing protein [Acidobacteriaceae bacterium]
MTESFSALFLSADPQPLRGSLLAQKVFSLFFGFVLVLGIVLPLSAQTVTTGQLTGIVTDPAGAAVVNGKLTLTSDDTGEVQNATTSTSGEFRFSLLRPGNYTIVVSAPGFESLTQ